MKIAGISHRRDKENVFSLEERYNISKQHPLRTTVFSFTGAKGSYLPSG